MICACGSPNCCGIVGGTVANGDDGKKRKRKRRVEASVADENSAPDAEKAVSKIAKKATTKKKTMKKSPRQRTSRDGAGLIGVDSK